MALAPRLVVVHRRTEYEELVARHGTRQQVGFFLSTRGRTLDEVEARHAAQHDALAAAIGAAPVEWRRGTVERADLARFAFSPDDIVVAVGQDGLVANVAKYLTGQPVVGINPEPARYPGVLVQHPPAAARQLLGAAARMLPAGVAPATPGRVMVEAELDDGQVIRALNELYVGHPSHQSARYRVSSGEAEERQSSSGVLVGTGTGSTGWCRSVWQERQSTMQLPRPDEAALCWFVREAWPSPATGTTQVEGRLQEGHALTITAESELVVFGDGIEADRLLLGWGQSVRVRIAAQRLQLVEADHGRGP